MPAAEPTHGLRAILLLSAEARAFADVDYRQRIAVVAEVDDGQEPELIGVARYGPSDQGTTADIGLVVEDGWQGLGLGSILLEEILRAGEHRGIRQFSAEVLTENRRALGLLARHPTITGRSSSDGVTSIDMQMKLLKLLDCGELRRVGGLRTTVVDVRVLMATNRNLDELVRAGRVREDLLYRIDVIRVTLPPLRHRPEDVPAFVSYFSARQQARGLGPKTFTQEAVRALQQYPWPGNVRELGNTIERLMVLSPGSTIDVRDLPAAVRSGRPVFQLPLDDLSLSLEELQRRHVLRVLDSVTGTGRRRQGGSGSAGLRSGAS